MSLHHYWRIFNKKGKLIKVYWRDDPNFYKVKDRDLVIKACLNKVFKVYKIKKWTDLEYLYWIGQSGLVKLEKEALKEFNS
jgi:hypothetical protein